LTFNKIKMAIYSTILTNYYGFKLTKFKKFSDKKKLRIEYSTKLLNKLNIKIKVVNEDRLPRDGQYLLISNHRSIIDPLIIETATQNTNIFGHWVAKKELYNSAFFGKFVRNSGTILLDREASKMSGFFKDIKTSVAAGSSIFIFPEGTRNNTNFVISEFKEGSQIIALKNRLPILPIFIRSKADKILKSAIKDSSKEQIIEIEVGEVIDYKHRNISLENSYKEQFNIA